MHVYVLSLSFDSCQGLFNCVFSLMTFLAGVAVKSLFVDLLTDFTPMMHKIQKDKFLQFSVTTEFGGLRFNND